MTASGHRVLLMVLPILLILFVSTVQGALFQNRYKRLLGKENRNKEDLSKETLHFYGDHSSQNNNGYNEDRSEESSHFPRPRRLLFDMLIRNLAKAKEKYEQANPLINEERERNVGYYPDDFMDTSQSSRIPQQKSIIKDNKPQARGGHSETAINRGNGITAKRADRPSLSIVSPLDVLSQRLMLEMARRKMKQSQHQIMANAALLKHLGKRNLLPTQNDTDRSNDYMNTP
ncbi:uncharacterized protein LOC143223198 [Tachypleus tridentatus]|uniref:uncharacterized protein LOC143223198 n=1 Tax=Tachypleus tridentatus TaxID=6853 RepID=UPI003FD356DE